MVAQGAPVEITIREVEGDDDVRASVFDLQFGDRQIEVTYVAHSDVAVNRWIQDVRRVHRERTRGAAAASSPGGYLLVGLCTFRRKPSLFGRRTAAAKAGDHAISLMSLCAAGTDKCLLVAVDDREDERSSSRRHPLPRHLAAFLADRDTRFAGIGVKSAAERLQRVGRVHVANAAELRPLVAAAFERHAVPPLKGGGGDADGLREMARVVLAGVDAGKKPAAVECSEWSGCWGYSDDEIMYAAVDAFLSSEIAEACLEVKPSAWELSQR